MKREEILDHSVEKLSCIFGIRAFVERDDIT